jgi:hypothetical protein
LVHAPDPDVVVALVGYEQLAEILTLLVLCRRRLTHKGSSISVYMLVMVTSMPVNTLVTVRERSVAVMLDVGSVVSVIMMTMSVYTFVTVRERSDAVMFDVCPYAGVVMTDHGWLWRDGGGERDLQRCADDEEFGEHCRNVGNECNEPKVRKRMNEMNPRVRNERLRRE